tara:strand:+ start:22377 stop:22613 length:237 start_codon:yes stop_codon:yes gene_type:complete
MKRIIIISGASRINKLRIHAILQRIIELEEENQLRRMKVFQPEPIPIFNHRLDFEPMNYYEHKPSKFMNKPKNNFKKR